MPVSLLLVALWVVAALGALAAAPRVQGPVSWALIVTGIPLLGLVTLQVGPVAGLGGLALGAVLIGRPRPARGEPLRSDR